MKTNILKLTSIFLCLSIFFALPSFAVAANGMDRSLIAESKETETPSEVADGIADDYEFKFVGETVATSSKAIVVIPGVGGTVLRNSSGQTCWLWLSTARLNQLACSTTGASNNTITAGTGDYGVFDLYEPLCSMLENYYGDEYDVLFFPYDWRLSNTNAAASLAISINNSYDEVILVAHSMGGLVASKYLANSSVNRNKVDKLVTLGTPYTGTPHLIYVAETGDFNSFLSVLGYESTIKDLVQNFHCTYQLAPTVRYQDNYGAYIRAGTTYYSGAAARTFYSGRPWATVNGSTKTMYSSATAFHSGLIVSGTHIANSSLVDTYKIVGTGEDTASIIIYTSNGAYSDVEVNNSGDGTVPRYSASNTQSISTANKIYTVSDDHMGLINNSTVFSRIRTIIGESRGSSTTYNSEDENVAVNEKGWLIGENNRRTYITLNASYDINISDETGNNLIIDSSGVYNKDGDKLGSVWLLSNNRVKYIMKDGEYNVQINGNANKEISFVVEYQNDGYYEHSETYSDILEPCININISTSDMQSISVIAADDTSAAKSLHKTILPTHTMTPEELAERNS